MERKFTFRLVPGSMGVVSVACNLFGIDNVDPGGWGTPVYLTCDLTDAEIKAAQELLTEYEQQFPAERRCNAKIERMLP